MLALVLQQQVLELVAPRINPRQEAAGPAQTETQSPPIGSLCGRPSAIPEARGKSSLSACSGRNTPDGSSQSSPPPASPTWPPYPHGSHCGPTVSGVPIGCRLSWTPKMREVAQVQPGP